MTHLRQLVATRYLTALREGGSVPAVVEADDGALYVMKFAGAAQGCKALIAELVAGEIGRALGLPIPEIVFLTLDVALGPSEPHEEIRDLLRRSVGLNLGMRFLPQAFAYNPRLPPGLDPATASLIVWFDAFVMNVDRTLRNINMLTWQKRVWLIDHGAALYFHHDWRDYLARGRSAFPLVKDHALLLQASQLAEMDDYARELLTEETLAGIVALIPDDWLGLPAPAAAAEAHRRAYYETLAGRLDASAIFVAEALRARSGK